MKWVLNWHIILDVKDKQKAEKKLKKIFSHLNMDFSIKTIEKYWKIPEYQECYGITLFDENSFSDAIFHVLKSLSEISSSNIVQGPRDYTSDNASCDFLIVKDKSNHITISGIIMIDMYLHKLRVS